MSLLKQILGQNSHWQVNKDLARTVGIEAAILLSDLIDKWIFFEYPEWFYNTSENIQNDTTLSRKIQERVLKILEDNNLIEIELQGMPAKRHFKILENNILQYFKKSVYQFVPNGQTSLPQTDKQDCPKSTNKYVPNGQTCLSQTDNKIRINNNNKHKNKREVFALDFLIENAPSVYEAFEMRFKKQISDFEKFKELVNCKIEEEGLEFSTKKINARLTRFAINYIENQNKQPNQSNQSNLQVEPAYRKNVI